MIGEIQRVLDALNRARVRYLVVGGVAVVLHGRLRATKDLDLVLELEPGNVRLALDALASLGFRPRPPVPMESFADPAERDRWICEKGLTVFALWNPATPGFEVDLFVREPFSFADVYARAVRIRLADSTHDTTVVPLDELVAMKRRAGRPQDLDDVSSLREIHGDEPDPPRTHG